MDEQRINLNTASAEELTRLPGIGPVLAQRIVDYRDTVHAYEEPEEITAVSGIGPGGYGRIADRVTVALPADPSVPTPYLSADRAEEGNATSESDVEGELPGEPVPAPVDEQASEKEATLQFEAAPPSESFSEMGLPLKEEEAAEEGLGSTAPDEGEPSPVRSEDREPEGEQEATGEEAVSVPYEEFDEGEPAEDLRPGWALPPAEATRSVSWWRRLSWLWTAILGGLLGMAFALVVWAGVNGSLDVAHSRAVLAIKGDMNGLEADIEAVRTDVEGLRRRLEALEGLTTRMEEAESAIDELNQQTSALREQTNALEEDIGALSKALQTISEDVASLQDQAKKTQSFFGGLQALLNDIFGEVEGMSAPTPTPTPEGQ